MDEEEGKRIVIVFVYTKAPDRLMHGHLPGPTHTLDDLYC